MSVLKSKRKESKFEVFDYFYRTRKEFDDWYSSWYQNQSRMMSRQQKEQINKLYKTLREDSMYKITLNDGTVIDNLTMNGNNYVSPTEVDTSIFTRKNLSSVVVNDGEKDETLTNLLFVQETHMNDGYYFILRQMTDSEIAITDIQEALADIYEMNLGGTN